MRDQSPLTLDQAKHVEGVILEDFVEINQRHAQPRVRFLEINYLEKIFFFISVTASSG